MYGTQPGKIEEIKYLIQLGGDVNSHSGCLTNAAINGSHEAVKILLQHGAKVNGTNYKNTRSQI